MMRLLTIEGSRRGLVLRGRRMDALRELHLVEVRVVGRSPVKGQAVAWMHGEEQICICMPGKCAWGDVHGEMCMA